MLRAVMVTEFNAKSFFTIMRYCG